MNLEQAIAYAIDHEGISIISEARFVNYLNDLQAFSSPALKRIVSAMVEEGYFDRLRPSLSSENHEIVFNDIESRLVSVEGFQQNLVKFVLDCLLYAVHKTGTVPVLPMIEAEKKIVRKKATVKSDCPQLNFIHANGSYLVEFNGKSYELNEGQVNAIKRKQRMPADRLEVWLNSYAEENK